MIAYFRYFNFRDDFFKLKLLFFYILIRIKISYFAYIARVFGQFKFIQFLFSPPEVNNFIFTLREFFFKEAALAFCLFHLPSSSNFQ